MKVCVFGAGNMGARITEVFLNAGHDVTMIDIKPEFTERGKTVITHDYEFLVSKGKMTAERKDELLASLKTSVDRKDAADADFVMEVILERMDLKKDLLEDLDWYIDYYGYLESHDYNGLPYRQEEPERYLLAEPIRPGEDIYGTAGKRLTQMQHSPQFTDAHFLRCHGYLLDFRALLEGRVLPTHYFVYLRRQPLLHHPNLMTVPAGPYLCVQARILAQPFDGQALRPYFRNARSVPLVLANEYEDNFTSFTDCVYEIQIQTGHGS